jgi:hemin uptake protein HemP
MLVATSQSQAHATHAERPSPGGNPTYPHDEVDSARLLRGQREILIRHGSETYRLRHTRNDKLILTK